LSLRQDGDRFGPDEPRDIAEQLGKRRERPGRHHVEGARGGRLDALRAHVDIEAGGLRGGAQIRALLSDALHEGRGDAPAGEGGGEDEARKSAPGAEIDQRRGVPRNQREQLKGIRIMTVPALGNRRTRHKIVRRGPFDERPIQPRDPICGVIGESVCGDELVEAGYRHDAAAERFTWPATSATAVGVTPSSRPAWPRVAGRAEARRSRTSADSPGTAA